MWDFLLNGHETLRAKHEALNAICVENVRWVAAKLDDMLDCGVVFLGSSAATVIELIFELVCLHLQLGEGKFAALAIV